MNTHPAFASAHNDVLSATPGDDASVASLVEEIKNRAR